MARSVTALACLATALAGAPHLAVAQTSPETIALPPVDVTAPTPLLGSGLDRDSLPAETHVLDRDALQRNGTPDLIGALARDLPGVTLSDAAGNPFQPTLVYHGFQASPLQGTSQGMAVYVDGQRFNQAFGDTVNWDLLPDVAIDTVNVTGANPVFGLNALGGAVAVRLRNGFTWQGAEAGISGGSFGRIGSDLQWGRISGDTAIYLAASAQHQDGWRDFQSSDLGNLFADIGWRGPAAELHLNLTVAGSRLNGPGTVPVDLLAADRAAQFTGPNAIDNQYANLRLTGQFDLSADTSLDIVTYAQFLQQRVVNGNVADFAPCNDGSNLLCTTPGTRLTTTGGAPIGAFLAGAPYAQLDRQTTRSNSVGATAQISRNADLFGHANKFVTGFSVDLDDTLFAASTAAGGLTLDQRNFIGPGITIDQADGSIAPVRVRIGNAAGGIYLADTLQLTDRLGVTGSARFNAIATDLHDQLGGALSGNHDWTHLNTALGASYELADWVSAYGGIATTNRAPTPAELSCASAAAPCSLANFFVGDPNLKQVLARTIEIGLRGRSPVFAGSTLEWRLAGYQTDLVDDIAFVNSPIEGRAYFRNVGATQRRGFDAEASLTAERWRLSLAWSHIEAMFRTAFIEASPNNPAADGNGDILVTPGSHMPGIPRDTLKLGARTKLSDAWTLGGNLLLQSDQFLFGDEANLTARLPGFAMLQLTTSYELAPGITLTGTLENALNARYATYGTFSPVGSIPIVQAPGASNPRSLSPAAPLGGFGGLRVKF